jgi:predicted dehydrogenase
MAIRIGLAGGGLVAQAAHLPALGHLRETFAVAALADPSRTVREQVAARFGIPRAYAGWPEMLERAGLDALIVGTPNETHAEIVLAALDAGLHVLVEKPLCIALEDADRVVAAQERTGRVVQVAYMKRHAPGFAAARAAIAANDVRLVQTTTIDPVLAAEPFFGPGDLIVPRGDAPRESGSALAAQLEAAIGTNDPAFSTLVLGALSHDVNTVLGLLGEPDVEPVHGALHEQALTATWRLPGGAHWQAAFAFLPGSGRYVQRLEVSTAEAQHRLEFGAPYLQELGERATRTTADTVTVVGAPGGGHRGPYTRQLEHFADCIAGRATCATPATQGRRDIAVLTRLYREQLR